mgnify:CR=1 FL=1
MYTSYNSSLEKNQMLTPPTIGLTSSIVNDKLSNIVLEDNSSSSGLFTTNEDKTAIQTKDGIPLEASQFRITGTNDEIDSNENNAVNKRYLSNKIGNLDDKYMKKDVKSLNLNELNINSVSDHNLKISSDKKDKLLEYIKDIEMNNKNFKSISNYFFNY